MKYGAVVWSLSTVLAVCHSGPAAAQEQEASHYEYKWGGIVSLTQFALAHILACQIILLYPVKITWLRSHCPPMNFLCKSFIAYRLSASASFSRFVAR